jgi:dienelactone hydrolase
MLPVGHGRLTPLDADLVPPDGGLALDLELLVDGRVVARTAARRLLARPDVTTRLLSRRRDGVVGRFATTGGADRRPAVLVLGGSEGGLSRNPTAELLASHGYDALQLAYFGEPGLPPELERIPLEYLVRALRWLAARPGVDPERLFLLGASRGAELALILGSRFPALVHGVAAYAPSSYVVPALDGVTPAWTHHGAPVRPVVLSGGWADPRSAEGRAAAIPVERIPGPVLLVGGGSDLVWPSGDFVEAIADRLRARGKRNFASVVHPEAGHAVAAKLPLLPLATFSSSGRSAGGFPQADAAARTRAWAVLLGMLERSTRR